MKRLFCCLLAAVMALSMLSGCGSTENSGDSGDTLLLATTQPMYEPRRSLPGQRASPYRR